MRTPGRRQLAFFFILGLTLLTLSAAAHPPVRPQGLPQVSQAGYHLNPARELELLKKILAFERNWKIEARDTLVVGILFQSSNPISVWTMEDWISLPSPSLPEDNRAELPGFLLKPVDLESPQPLEDSLREMKVRFLYLTPLELSKKPKLLPYIFKACEKLRVGTATAVPEYVEAGAALGLIWTGEKFQVVINLEAARAQGLNFSSQFLRLATVRKGHD